MRKPRCKYLQKSSMTLLTLFFFLLLGNSSFSDEIPPADEAYRKFFVEFSDNRSNWEKLKNFVGHTDQDVGRSFALIAGVSYYPNMSVLKQKLRPAAEDIKMLKEYLVTYEYFDEIVVLENKDMTTENLEYFLQSYFPKRLKKFPKSRFLFAYSGHGMNEGTNGYLLKNTARNLTDKTNSINLRVLKVYVDEVVDEGHQVLVLLNACYGGVFLGRSPYGESKKYIPDKPGAHAITAGGSGELTWHNPEVGFGSVFFEKIIAGLGGIADVEEDGVITVHELTVYLKREVNLFTDELQNPQLGDISRHGCNGEFFFLNREKQIAQKVVPEFNLEKATPMGINAYKLLSMGEEYYNSGDYSSAIPFFRQSGEAGDTEAMNYLGYMYHYGFGVTQNYDEAVRWYRKGGEAGNGLAMSNLGYMYHYGFGVTQNYDEAVRWYRKGVEAGDALAMSNLGYMYHYGFGVAQNYAEAVRWYRKGAEAGDALAMSNLGYMYHYGFGVAQNYAEAVRWYRKGAEAGNAKAMANLGIMYSDGFGVTQNYDEAARWYRKGAEAGNAMAMNNLGTMYQSGFGVTKNYAEAVRWYRKGANAGNALAMFNLGFLYENGEGVARDYAEAVRWFRKAADAGDEDAINRLKKLGESP